MTKKNITITSLAAALVLSMAALAMAGPGYGYGRGGCNGQGINSAYSQLTPEKQQAVDKITEKYQAQFETLRTAMWTKHSTLQAMINGGDANEKKIGKLTAEITDLRDQMWNLRSQMSDELVKETGVTNFRFGGRGGFHGGPGYQGRGDCPAFEGANNSMGRGQGRGMYRSNY